MSALTPDVEEMNARLAAIVTASSDAIISYGADATILTWNPAAERVLGYTAEEVIGQPMSIIADRAVTSVSATLCDLSERKRAEERFRALLESAPIRFSA